jgi:hypothetical protein
LGISPNFAIIDTADLVFPATLRIDWIRVYQPTNAINIGCDPKDYPTSAYINEYAPIYADAFLVPHDPSFRYIEAYTNPNLTTWQGDFNQPFPKNKLKVSC